MKTTIPRIIFINHNSIIPFHYSLIKIIHLISIIMIIIDCLNSNNTPINDDYYSSDYHLFY